MKTINSDHPIVLFDGVCNLCSNAVQFIIRWDTQGIFRFASLQSNIGQALLVKKRLSPEAINTIVLVEEREGRIYDRSTAALQIARRMDGIWPILYIMIYIPEPIRNYVYDIIARHRYRWFGRKDSCMIPKKEINQRFLD
jgi:predicted DCC family thiol-disulfide oxidoreductase YuxK